MTGPTDATGGTTATGPTDGATDLTTAGPTAAGDTTDPTAAGDTTAPGETTATGPAHTTDVDLPTAADTHAFGVALGERLRAGDLVILSGALGAGKTALTRGIGAGLQVSGTVASPTFVLARTHRPGPPGVGLVHVDAYRLAGALELDDLDLDTDLVGAAVVVEWGEGLAERLTDAHLRVELDRHPDDTRTARLVPVGGDWAGRLAGLI